MKGELLYLRYFTFRERCRFDTVILVTLVLVAVYLPTLYHPSNVQFVNELLGLVQKITVLNQTTVKCVFYLLLQPLSIVLRNDIVVFFPDQWMQEQLFHIRQAPTLLDYLLECVPYTCNIVRLDSIIHL